MEPVARSIGTVQLDDGRPGEPGLGGGVQVAAVGQGRQRRDRLDGVDPGQTIVAGIRGRDGEEDLMSGATGSIGIKANQRESIELAHRFGFEAVLPFAQELAALSGDDLNRLRDELKAKDLAWAAAHLSVDFRRGEE